MSATTTPPPVPTPHGHTDRLTGTVPPARRRPRLAAVRRWTTRVLATIGAVGLIGLAVGLVADYRSFDGTRGGYEPPYTGWTGTPIDWDAADVTDEGFRKQGYVMDVAVDCTTGLITFELFGASYDWRPFSGRALAVHQPREACAAAGFSPRF